MNILILNCFSRNALAVINSLDKSYNLIGAVEKKKNWRKKLQKSCFHSNKITSFAEHSDPIRNPDGFKDDLIKICLEHNIDTIFPTGTTATNYLSFFKEQIENKTNAVLLVEGYEKFQLLTDKWQAVQFCQNLSVPVPTTILLENTPETLEKISLLKFPIVAKPRISYASHGVYFFNSYDEFSQSVGKLVGFKSPDENIDFPYIVQEMITGDLCDVALCAKDGKPLLMMSQDRVMTLRDFGGGGIINKTTYEPEMMEYAEKVIGQLNWNGPALFDFIRTKDSQFYLLEINPKIWGTTRLIVEAGMNLPQTMIDTFVLNQKLNVQVNYEKDLLYKWMFPECVAAWFLPPFRLNKIVKRMRKSFSNHGAKRVCHNMKAGDIKHLIGTVLEKS